MSMICPETYYEMNLKGKTSSQILTCIRSLKREINRLKYLMEHPDYQPTICPSEDVRISCSRDYLARAIQALEDLGGTYTPTKAEQRAIRFDDNIQYISKIEFCTGGFFDGYETRIYTMESDTVHTEIEHSLILKPSNMEDCSMEEIDKEEFLDSLRDIHIGEWRANYDPMRYGYAVLDGTQWHLHIYYSNGHRPVKIEGSNAYPYNFKQLTELLEVAEKE